MLYRSKPTLWFLIFLYLVFSILSNFRRSRYFSDLFLSFLLFFPVHVSLWFLILHFLVCIFCTLTFHYLAFSILSDFQFHVSLCSSVQQVLFRSLSLFSDLFLSFLLFFSVHVSLQFLICISFTFLVTKQQSFFTVCLHWDLRCPDLSFLFFFKILISYFRLNPYPCFFFLWSEVVFVDVLCPSDPRGCQVDARFYPWLSSGSVFPAKDVRTGGPDTPSDGFVSHVSRT